MGCLDDASCNDDIDVFGLRVGETLNFDCHVGTRNEVEPRSLALFRANVSRLEPLVLSIAGLRRSLIRQVVFSMLGTMTNNTQ